MIKKRIIAAFLVVMTVFSTCALMVNAQESAPEAEKPIYEFNTGKNMNRWCHSGLQCSRP